MNQHQGHGPSRLIDVLKERRLGRVDQSYRRATVAQIAEKRNAGHDRKVSELTVHCSLLLTLLCRQRPVRQVKIFSGGWPGACALFTWETDGSRMHYGKVEARGSVMLWPMFCWKI